VHTHDLLPLTAPADHAGLRDRVVRLLTPGSLRRADRVLTVSATVAAEIRALFPETAAKLTAIPDGIETDFFCPRGADATPGPIHARIGWAGPYVLCLGALSARKNLEVAIRGFGEYRARRDPAAGEIKLVLAGMCRSRAYESRIRRLADAVAPAAVRFAGFVDDEACRSLLQHAAVVLAPSRGEGFDLPPLEAMSCAVPVVCSELPVHRELLGDDAVYFPTDQPTALADALLRLDTDPALRRRLARQGPARAARYTWPAAMQSLANLYGELLASARARPVPS
jgi:glycosyltransferase involved in cell wall biosynthesis